MDQLNFKNWIEAVQLVRSFQDSHKLTPLGKLGWWSVYSAKDPSLQQSPDFVVELRDSKVRPVFEEAAQRLSKLGFPQMHSNVVIVGIDEVNPITGGGIGGAAYNKNHGFTVSRKDINANTVIHEHAHMYWFNLPKHNQEYFKEHYKSAISNVTIGHQDMWRHSQSSFEKKGLDESIETTWSTFQERMANRLKYRFDSYFEIQKALGMEDESRIIESTVLSTFGKSCEAIAKVEIPLNDYSSIKPGEKVLVQKYDRFILVKPTQNHPRPEHESPVSRQKLHDMVLFKPELLYQTDHMDQVKEMTNMIKTIKDKPSKFFAPHKQKEEIEGIFGEMARNIAANFGFDSRKYSPSTFSAEQLFPNGRFYQTWMSRIGRRFKAGKIKGMDDLKKVYIDAVKSQAKGDLSEVPANINPDDLHKKGYDYQNIGNEKGGSLRNLIHQQGIVPSPYAASNVDELWAVSVEHAAMDWEVSRELKKLIYSTVSGTKM